MNDPPIVGDQIDYRALIEGALKSVVRTLLTEVAEKGLPGDHHFYLTFRTDHREAELPTFLRQRYPDEMTIVLQHQFCDLVVTETRFSVRLRFDGKLHRVEIPFAALCGFADPAAELALAFRAEGERDPPPDGELSMADSAPEERAETSNLVSLEGFRRRRDSP